MMNTKKQRAIFKLAKIQHEMFFNSNFESFEKKFPRGARKRRIRAKWASRFRNEETQKPFHIKLNDRLDRLKSQMEKGRDERNGEFCIPIEVMREYERIKRIFHLAEKIAVMQEWMNNQQIIVPSGARVAKDTPGVRIIEVPDDAPPSSHFFGFYKLKKDPNWKPDFKVPFKGA